MEEKCYVQGFLFPVNFSKVCMLYHVPLGLSLKWEIKINFFMFCE